MALANKEHLLQNECAAMAIIQASAFYDQDFGGPSLIPTSSNSSPENHIYGVYGDPDSPEKAGKRSMNSSTVSSPSSTNSNGLGYSEGNSVITFKPSHAGSLLSFDQTKKLVQRSLMNPKIISEEDEYPMYLHYQTQMNPETSSSPHDQWAWLNDQDPTGAPQIDPPNNKRPSTGENLQALKKQCVAASSKKPKPKAAAESKDPQSVAAKNRRERISERLKTLQELVPNGSKVDLVTMLEKAISYVKFLQLQVKVLATDEFWPVQGGKAPDLSQVREAIDAILASQRDRSSTSK